MDNHDEELYTPLKFDSTAFLREAGYKPYLIERHKEKIDFILHQIYIHRMIDKRYEKGDFIRLSSKYHFEKYLSTRHYPILKELLVDNGIIEEDSSYIAPSKENDYQSMCKGYRLFEEYDGTHRKISVDKDTTLFRKIKEQRERAILAQDKVTQWLNFHVKDISIHLEEAIDYVEKWYTENMLFTDNSKFKKKQRKRPYWEVIEEKRERYLYSIHAIARGSAFTAVRDKSGRRVHHPLTNLWTELRQFLYLKHEPDTVLYNLDIANSQPLCLVKILLDYYKGRSLPPDIDKYIQLVSEGMLYKYFTDKLNTAQDQVPNFKQTLFANVFYSANHKSFYTDEAILFREEFPSVYEVIQQEKRENYKDLSLKMQRVESTAIIDGVMTKLMHKYRDKHFFTSIHDSVICPEELIDEIKNLMEDYVEREVGIKPKVKQAEYFNYPFLEKQAKSA